MYYTKKGDGGTSGLYGSKERLPKDAAVFEALGTLDELNCWLGLCKASCKELETDVSAFIAAALERAQEDVFILQAQLAGADKELTQKAVDNLEKLIDKTAEKIPSLQSFCLPGASKFSALLDVARTVARRCERRCIPALSVLSDATAMRAYLNRLSSLLYVLVRYANQAQNLAERAPSYNS